MQRCACHASEGHPWKRDRSESRHLNSGYERVGKQLVVEGAAVLNIRSQLWAHSIGVMESPPNWSGPRWTRTTYLRSNRP